MQSYPKRLIEVDLPIKRISAHARREKSIRHGHISTLHIWWARRPLAACRAVICAALWPDPVDALCPESFRQVARQWMERWSKENLGKLGEESYQRFVTLQKNPERLNDNEALRAALLDFIADFANWDNSTDRAYLETSRALTHAAHEALGGEPGTRPLVADPFAGGGSIPLEALRVGADAFASALNPIPVLLNKVVLEYIPKYGQRLADEVRKWGEWIKREAEKELAEFYPKDTDGATPIAFLWARTIQCEGPSCGAEDGLLAYVGKGADGKYVPFLFERSLEPADVEISDETFIVTRETALAYREAQTTPAIPYVPSTTEDHPSVAPRIEESLPPGRHMAAAPTVSISMPAGGRALVWNAEIPAQKWMTFYTRVLSKFATGNGLRLTVRVEVTPEDGVSEQKIEETRSALMELGLNDRVD